MTRGVFWLVGNELLAFPFSEDSAYEVAKSGKTYNHEKLWEHIKQNLTTNSRIQKSII